jgi:amidohydrolase
MAAATTATPPCWWVPRVTWPKRATFDGTAVLIFQPGEEGFAGAQAMIDDGLFERFPVQSVFGMHNWPAMRPGTIGLNPGPMMAAADHIRIDITGQGGHGAHAYQTVDPVLVAGHIITAVQSIVSRNVKPVDSAVISLCGLQAGDLNAMSVIPGSATLVGTVRTFSATVQALVERRLMNCAAPSPRVLAQVPSDLHAHVPGHHQYGARGPTGR